MINFKKKFLAGLLGSALLLTGAQTFAQPPEMHMQAHMQMQMTQERITENINAWAKYLSEKYGVDKAQVEEALTRGVNIKDIQFASVLSKLSGKSFSDVLAMKVDWLQVAEKLGITREQLQEFHRQQQFEALALTAGVEVKTVESLLKDGYHPQDIIVAGKIAKSAGKDIKTVLGKRKINNTWGDVAKSFGLDITKIMPPPPKPEQSRE